MPPRKSKTTLDEAIEMVGDERDQVVGDAWLADELQREENDAAAKEAEDAAERRRQREEETTKGAQEERPIKKKKRPTRRAWVTAPTAGSDTDSVREESPPPPPPKKGRARYGDDDPRRKKPPPSVALLLADRACSLERAESVSSTTSSGKTVYYVDKTVLEDEEWECLLIDGSDRNGVHAYVAQTLVVGVNQGPYQKATRPKPRVMVTWPPGSLGKGQVLTPYVSTNSTSGVIKNTRDLQMFARSMRKEMGDKRRVKFKKVGRPGVLEFFRLMPRRHLVGRAVRIAALFEESLEVFVEREILKPDGTLVPQGGAADMNDGDEGVASEPDMDEDAPAPVEVPSLAVVQSSRRRRLPPSWPSRVAFLRPLG